MVQPLNWASDVSAALNPVAWITRIGVSAIAVICHGNIGDEIVARQQLAACRGARQIGMVIADTGVEIGYDYALAALGNGPGFIGVNRRWLHRLQGPLAADAVT